MTGARRDAHHSRLRALPPGIRAAALPNAFRIGQPPFYRGPNPRGQCGPVARRAEATLWRYRQAPTVLSRHSNRAPLFWTQLIPAREQSLKLIAAQAANDGDAACQRVPPNLSAHSAYLAHPERIVDVVQVHEQDRIVRTADYKAVQLA